MERDATGERVPSRLESVFKRRREIESWSRAVEKLQDTLARMRLDPSHHRINTKKVRAHLAEACGLMRRGAPFSYCRRCKASDLDCPDCKGQRWVTAEKYHEQHAVALK